MPQGALVILLPQVPAPEPRLLALVVRPVLDHRREQAARCAGRRRLSRLVKPLPVSLRELEPVVADGLFCRGGLLRDEFAYGFQLQCVREVALTVRAVIR